MLTEIGEWEDDSGRMAGGWKEDGRRMEGGWKEDGRRIVQLSFLLLYGAGHKRGLYLSYRPLDRTKSISATRSSFFVKTLPGFSGDRESPPENTGGGSRGGAGGTPPEW